MDTNEGTQSTGTETPAAAVAKPEPLAIRKAAILARMTGGGGAAAAVVGDEDAADLTPPGDAAKPKTGETPAATDGEGDHTARIADLSKQLRELGEQLTEAKGKIPTEDKYATLIARAKDDPAVLLDDLAEHGITLESISTSFLKRQDNPAHKELTAQQKEIADLKARLDAKEKAEKDATTASEASKAEATGREAVKTMVDGDKARWPVITAHADNASEAIPDAIAAARIVGKKLGRLPTAAEAEKILGDCLDEIEKSLTAKGARYRKPDIAPAAPARRTIAAPAGTTGGPRAASGAAPQSLSDRKREIVAAARRAGQPKS